MIISIGIDGLKTLVLSQLENMFLCNANETECILNSIPSSLSKAKKCFQATTYKYHWTEKGELMFNPYHSGQYSIFLFFLSQTIWKKGCSLLADKVYYLNKLLNACDLFYQIELPEIFFLHHPIGSVIGRASFGDYFIFQQNCTVGNNNEMYPSFGEFVWLFANSAVIGDAKIGSNVFVAANTFIKDEIIPDNTIVFGHSPNLTIKRKPKEYFYGKSPFKIHTTAFCE